MKSHSQQPNLSEIIFLLPQKNQIALRINRDVCPRKTPIDNARKATSEGSRTAPHFSFPVGGVLLSPFSLVRLFFVLEFTSAWAENRALLGSNPSADPGAKTGVGMIVSFQLFFFLLSPGLAARR